MDVHSIMWLIFTGMSAVPDIKEKILLIILDPKLKHFVYEADALDETLINNTINIIR